MTSHLEELRIYGTPIVAVLMIDKWRTICSMCGGGANPEEFRHETALNDGTTPPRSMGCGATFVATAVAKGSSVSEMMVRTVRQDLPFVEISR